MIFTERTIRVTNGASQINSPIVLYKGDKNIKIRFKIVDCPYTYSKNVDNIIEVSEASYAQLIIKTPNDGLPIFSDIAATESGYVTFTITGEMIDEAKEVGKYSFQVRLLDSEQFSRITIPEVVDGIDVRDPIAIEGVSATNEVDVAVVNYAVTTAAATEDAFNSEGNYNKTTWGAGDRITAAKLNKIEAGIDGVNKKVASGGTGSGEVDLSSYAKKTDLPTKTSQLTNDSGYITSIPDEYITETELNAKGYATTSQIPTVPTNVSEFTNDAHYASETYVTNKIAEAQLGGGSGTVDLSGYVTKETGNANQITFADGQTFQAKLDAGTLKGEKGDAGEQGPQGPQGEMGPAGATTASGVSITDTANNFTATDVEGALAEASSQIKEKVNQNQGSEYAGNYLGIAEDGSVVPMPVIGGGSSETTYELIGTLPQTTTFRPVQLLANEDTTITIGDNASAPISDKIITGENLYNPIYYTNIESYEFNSTNGITMKRVDGAIPNNAYLYIAVPVSIGVQYTISAINKDGAYWRVGESDRNAKEVGASTKYVTAENLSSYVTTQDTRQSLTYTPTKAYIIIEVRPWSNQTGTINQIMVTTDGSTEYKESTVINLTAGKYYEYVNTVGETIPAPVDGTTVELYKKTSSGGGADLSSLYTYVDNKVATKLDKSGHTESGNLVVNEDGNVTVEQGLANDKVYVFLGDSIPTFDSNTGGIGAIPDYMQNMIGGTWHNFGIGGTTMAAYRLSDNTYDMFTFGEWADSIASGNFTKQETGITNGVGAGSTSYSATNKVSDAKALDWATVDTICVHFGTNDLAYKVSEVGTSADAAAKNGTMCASLKYAIEKIHSVYPKVKIVVCGIIYRNADSVSVSDIIGSNKQLKETCYTEGVRFVDLFGEMEVNATNKTTFLYDGTHPNADGKQRYAECLARYIY